MEQVLLRLPAHLKEGYAKGKESVAKPLSNIPRALLFCGVGGSGAGGSVLRRILLPFLPFPFLTIAAPPLPPWVDSETLCIVSSYSGHTEETLTLAREAKNRKAFLVFCTSGGPLRELREDHEVLLLLPGGLQPRCALGYTVGGLLGVFEGLFPVLAFQKDLEETVTVLRELLPEYARGGFPLEVAKAIAGTIPVAVGFAHYTDFASWRFKTQLNENAKHTAFASTLPEAMHNEIVGFSHPSSLPLSFLFFHDPEEPVFFTTMARAYAKHVTGKGMPVFEVWAKGESSLARAMSLVAFADWVSLHLARLHGEDPVSIPAIRHLKHLFRKLECTFEGGGKV
jgi:glucose/mannose-6-phosphate isomerase